MEEIPRTMRFAVRTATLYRLNHQKTALKLFTDVSARSMAACAYLVQGAPQTITNGGSCTVGETLDKLDEPVVRKTYTSKRRNHSDKKLFTDEPLVKSQTNRRHVVQSSSQINSEADENGTKTEADNKFTATVPLQHWLIQTQEESSSRPAVEQFVLMTAEGLAYNRASDMYQRALYFSDTEARLISIHENSAERLALAII
ncbi:hypothetical protein OSTOST_00869 [Ostertagia ostertagi]